MLHTLSYASPELIWGLLARGLGLVYLVAFASSTFQVIPVAGAQGIAPVAALMRAIEQHFPTYRRFFYFPSLLWINRSDAALRALPWLGVAAALSAIAGGPHTPWAFAICYAAYLSLDRALVLVYPWDSLLLEAGFWAMLLPPLQFVPQLSAVAAPLPALAWLYRLLLFRVMFGFGKQKFLGSTARDAGFLKGFYIRQPLPTRLGWLAHRLPMPLHKLALAIMFLVEVPLPFAFLVPGPASVWAALATAGLMFAIWATGNFGYFNLLTIALCLCALDTQTALALSLPQMFSPAQPVWQLCAQVLIALHTAGAIISLPFNTWCSFTWTLWPLWARLRPRFLAWPIAALRALQPLRWLHAYGVFPPRSAPAVRLAPVLEVTWDEQHWHALRHRYSPTTETCAPRLCAPHHARLEQAIVYESVGFNETGALRNLSGRWDPYGHAKVSGAQRLVQRVLEADVDSQLFFDGSLDVARGAPRAARVRLYMLEPTTRAELRRSGHWWKRTLIGPHFPVMRLGNPLWDRSPPPPELWHFEDVVWLRRSHLGPLMTRAARGEDPHSLVLLASDDLSRADADLLWNEFVPSLSDALRRDWGALRETVDQLRARYEPEQRSRFERLTGRYGALLLARCEPLFLERGIWPVFGLATPTLDVRTHYHLGLLTHHIIGEGRAAYDAVFAEPRSAAAALSRMTLHSGALFSALFRYETLVHHSQKLRLLESQVAQVGRPQRSPRQERVIAWASSVLRRVFGAFDMIEFLRTQFAGERDMLDVPERWPLFLLAADGDILRKPAIADAPTGAHESPTSTP